MRDHNVIKGKRGTNEGGIFFYVIWGSFFFFFFLFIEGGMVFLGGVDCGEFLFFIFFTSLLLIFVDLQS